MRTDPARVHRPGHRTLLSRILLWMIVPLFLMWTIGIVITYFISLNLANSPYDRTLAGRLRLLRHEVEQQHLAQGVTLSGSARTVLAEGDDNAVTHWQVLDANGHLLAGNPDIPVPANWGYDIDEVHFRNARIGHQSVRVAYLWGGRDRDETGFLTVVMEPAEARATLQQEILTGMLTPQLIILPLAIMLAGLGLTQGREPLSLLQELMRRRKPGDLSPLQDDLAPAEIVPLIDAMNDVLQRLSASIESQRRFVANAAHQLKTPLAGIRTQCELALREEDPAQRRASLQQLIAGSQRATRLVNQLLLLARAESADPEQSNAAESLNLSALAEACTTDWVAVALQRRLDLGFEAPDEPLPIFGNHVMIRELLNNLVDNALLYTPAGGRVTVRTRAQGDEVCLEVQDTGPGIPPAEQAHVFDRFYRILGHGAGGSGLGLAIVHEIAEHHQATIAFLPPGDHRHAASAGTRLCVTFPRDQTRP